MCKCHAKGVKAVQWTLKNNNRMEAEIQIKFYTLGCSAFSGTSSAPRQSKEE